MRIENKLGNAESLERVKRQRGNNNPAGSEFIKRERMYEK